MIDKDLLRYITGKRKYIFFIVLFNIIGLFSSLLTTGLLIYIIKLIIDKAYNLIIYSVIILLIAIIIRIMVVYYSSYFSNKLANYVTYKLRCETYNKYLILHGRTPFTTSEMATLSTEGVEQLRLYYSSYLPSFFYAMLAPIILFILFMFINQPTAILYLACIPLIPISIIIVSKWAKKIFNKYWDKYTSLGDDFLDNTKGMKELKIFLYDAYKQEEMMENSEDFRKITMKVLTMQLASITIMDLVAFGGAAVGIVLSLIAMNNGLDVYKALFLILVGAEFFLPLRALGSAFHVAMNGATSGKKVIKLLDLIPEEDGKEDILSIDNIKINNLSFAYDNKKVLNDVSLELEKGLYSIVGLSGCGKSTLAKVLAKIERNNNTILINNNLLNNINSKCYYKKMCYISNNTYIFNQSIRNSFLMYRNDIREYEMLNLLKLVKLEHLSLDLVINDSISNISGGEKQRLALAFYLANDYDFYIFDEATSNIDIKSEEIILDIIKQLSINKIILLISHRLKNVINSKQIFHLEAGEIKYSGTFNELMNRDNSFINLYNMQTGLEDIYNEKA